MRPTNVTHPTSTAPTLLLGAAALMWLIGTLLHSANTTTNATTPGATTTPTPTPTATAGVGAGEAAGTDVRLVAETTGAEGGGTDGSGSSDQPSTDGAPKQGNGGGSSGGGGDSGGGSAGSGGDSGGGGGDSGGADSQDGSGASDKPSTDGSPTKPGGGGGNTSAGNTGGNTGGEAGTRSSGPEPGTAGPAEKAGATESCTDGGCQAPRAAPNNSAPTNGAQQGAPGTANTADNRASTPEDRCKASNICGGPNPTRPTATPTGAANTGAPDPATPVLLVKPDAGARAVVRSTDDLDPERPGHLLPHRPGAAAQTPTAASATCVGNYCDTSVVSPVLPRMSTFGGASPTGASAGAKDEHDRAPEPVLPDPNPVSPPAPNGPVSAQGAGPGSAGTSGAGGTETLAANAPRAPTARQAVLDQDAHLLTDPTRSPSAARAPPVATTDLSRGTSVIQTNDLVRPAAAPAGQPRPSSIRASMNQPVEATLTSFNTPRQVDQRECVLGGPGCGTSTPVIPSPMSGHEFLDAASYAPGIGTVAEVANGAWHAIEGNPEETGAAALGAIPGLKWLKAAGRGIAAGARELPNIAKKIKNPFRSHTVDNVDEVPKPTWQPTKNDRPQSTEVEQDGARGFTNPNTGRLPPSGQPHEAAPEPVPNLRPLTSNQHEALNYANRPEKLDHSFHPKHKLEPLVEKFGSREAVMEQVIRSLEFLPKSGTFEVAREIGGQPVTIRGAVVDGVPKIGTMFTP